MVSRDLGARVRKHDGDHLCRRDLDPSFCGPVTASAPRVKNGLRGFGVCAERVHVLLNRA
jgi:hypothetical protein